MANQMRSDPPYAMSQQQFDSNPSTSDEASGSSRSRVKSSSLATALDRNEAIHQTVEQSAGELVMVNTVLQQELPAHVQNGDVAQALEKADRIETTMHETAQELAEVNQALSDEVDHRMDLERQLAAAKSALAEAKTD